MERLRGSENTAGMPIVVYTARDLDENDRVELERLAESVIMKGQGSTDSLLRETALFLHRTADNLPESARRALSQGWDDGALVGKKVLIVDDDVRNIFSLASALEGHGIEVVFAENGRDGIETLKTTPGIDAMLVDIMMPELDGYETMREVRGIMRFDDLPIIAVTAKAMKGDRERCIEAGATDYIAKPVDIEQLVSMLRVRIGRETRVAEASRLTA
jgi:CheY-like chemotaxis protein